MPIGVLTRAWAACWLLALAAAGRARAGAGAAGAAGGAAAGRTSACTACSTTARRAAVVRATGLAGWPGIVLGTMVRPEAGSSCARARGAMPRVEGRGRVVVIVVPEGFFRSGVLTPPLRDSSSGGAQWEEVH